MKKLMILLWIPLLSIQSAVGQNKGYYGKKAFLEVTGLGSFPLINNWSNYGYYVKSGTGLVEGNDKFNAGVRCGLGFVVDPKVAISMTVDMSFLNTEGPGTMYYYDPVSDNFNQLSVKHENLKIRSLTFMPIVNFSTSGKGIIPAGFSHEIGIGYVRSKVMRDDYAFQLANDQNEIDYNGQTYDFSQFMDSVISVNGSHIDYSRASGGIMFMYGIKMRTPIKKQLLLNYGIRYTVNYVPPSLYVFFSSPSSFSTALNDDIADNIRQTRLRSFCSLQLGLTYLF